jgi:hypothetical protein
LRRKMRRDQPLRSTSCSIEFTYAPLSIGELQLEYR